jgi:hypothetical protein
VLIFNWFRPQAVLAHPCQMIRFVATATAESFQARSSAVILGTVFAKMHELIIHI